MAQAPSKAEGRAGFVIGASCPGCGGEVELSHDFFVTECRHCGSVLRLVMPTVPAAYCVQPRVQAAQARAALDRYLREQQLPLTRSTCSVDALLYPYWKLDFLAVKVRTEIEEFTHGEYVHGSYQEETTTQSRRNVLLTPFSTTSAAGRDDLAIPASIGLRADYLKLHPFQIDDTPESFSVCGVNLDVSSAMDRARASVKSLDAAAGSSAAGQHRTELVGVRSSVVYMPYYLITDVSSDGCRYVIDAVSGRVVSSGSAATEQELTPERVQPLGQIGLEPHRCKTCGQDLSVKPSLVYYCRNCGRTTLLGDAVGASVRCTLHTAEDLLVPFWKAGDKLVPAFRAGNVEAMYRLGSRASGALKNLSFDVPLGPDSCVSPVNVTFQEAKVAAAIADFRKSLDRNPKATLSDIDDQSTTGELLLIAFRARNYFWVDTTLDAISFERALLR